jgi:hypothetical protein
MDGSPAWRIRTSQNIDATDAGDEIATLRQLLDRVDLNGLLVQADALLADRPFSSTSSSMAPTSCRRQSSA